MATAEAAFHDSAYSRVVQEYTRRASHHVSVPFGEALLKLTSPVAVADLDATDRIVVFDGGGFPPERCYLAGEGRLVFSDLDGAAALVWDLDLVTSAGALVETLLSAQTVGRAAGQVALPNRLGVDISGHRLEVEITTAPGTPQAGTIQLFLPTTGHRIDFA